MNKTFSAAMLALAYGAAAHASVIDTQVFRLEAPKSLDGVYSVLSTQDGRVYYADPSDSALIEQLRAAQASQTPVHLVINDEHGDVIGASPLSPSEARSYIDAIVGTAAELEANSALREFDELPSEVVEALPEVAPTVETPAAPAVEAPAAEVAPAPAAAPAVAPIDEPEYNAHTFPGGYRPTILRTMAEAQALFDEERGLDHDSQCHERAMVWAHDMYERHGIKSMKTMMFFTEGFRSRYAQVSEGVFGRRRVKPYKWWYHTAPYVYVGSQIVVLDSEFLPSAVTLDQWTYWFTTKAAEAANARVPSMERARCRIISNYREYRSASFADQCQIRNFPMYYMQPNSVEALDCDPTRDVTPGKPRELMRDGRLKYPCFHEVLTGFRRSWVNEAYDNALTRRDRRSRAEAAEREEERLERIAELAEEARERAEDAREDAERAARRAQRDAEREARRAARRAD